MSADTNALFVVVAGLLYSGLSVTLGLLAPLLWPRKNLTKANRLLTIAYRLGLTITVCGAALLLLVF